MNGAMSREERRNLQKAFGPVAVEAIDRVQQLAFGVHTQQQVLARSVVDLEGREAGNVKKLHERVDGASAWAERAEQRANDVGDDLTHDKAAIYERLEVLEGVAGEFARFKGMTFLQRLAWQLFGILPRGPISVQEVNVGLGDQHIAYPGDGI